MWVDELREARAGRAWATNLALGLLGFGLLLLTRQFVSEWDHFRFGFSGCSGWSVWLYIAAMLVVFTQPTNRWTFPLIVGFAVALYAAVLFAPPFASTDIYRYVWDGVVQHAHVNPYRYVPGDKALTFLRDPNSDIFDNINRRDYARTIYPPAAQMVFWLATWFSPTVTAMKAFMVGFVGLAAWALLRMFAQLGIPRERLLLFCWCPLLVWEIGGAGHVDAAVLCFVTLAVMFRLHDRPWLTGLFLGLAVMTKFYPLVLFPALWQRRDWKMPSALVAVCLVGYSVYISAGRLVFGFLSGYAKEEGIDTGARFFLLELVQHVKGLGGLPEGAYMVFCAAVFGVIIWWSWKHATVETFAPGLARVSVRPGQVPAVMRASLALAFAMMLLFAPHYPWYIAWLVPLFALAPTLPVMTYLVMFFYMFTTSLAMPGPGLYLLNKIMYGVVALSFIVDFTLRRFDVWRPFRCETAVTRAVPERVAS